MASKERSLIDEQPERDDDDEDSGTARRRKVADPELKAMEALIALDTPTQVRVMTWLNSRLGRS